MLTYEYTARNPKNGEKITAEVQADSEQSAAKLITRQGLAPLEIKVKGQSNNPLGKIKSRITTKDKILFARQLSTLINAGLPLVQSLRMVSEQAQHQQMQLVINHIIANVEAGAPLSKSLAEYPKVFNQVFVSLVAAGETSGTLDKALLRLADQQEKDAEIVSKVRGAMTYPLIVLVVILAVVIFMLRAVLPQIDKLYKDMKQTLPTITQLLVNLSNFIGQYWWACLVVLGIIGFLLNRWRETEGGRAFLDKFKMNIPLFGRMFMKLYMARFTRTATTLVASGVPMLEMMRITAESINNVHIERSVKAAAEKVKAGKALSSTLEGDPYFLPLVPQMIKIGETSGALDAMLEKTATFYENELDNEIRTITTTIEPVLMVVLALIVMVIVAAILLPVYSLVNKINVA